MAVSVRDFQARSALEDAQNERLRQLLAEVLPRNAFYAARLAAARLDPRNVRCATDLQRLPCLTKDDLLTDHQTQSPYGSALTYPVERYCRLRQTSATSGRPL